MLRNKVIVYVHLFTLIECKIWDHFNLVTLLSESMLIPRVYFEINGIVNTEIYASFSRVE